ncbi:MAG: ABC transporter permease, partial [Xanthomonadales bacterium]|nr:ABC transporter permease [Xanthomonadales bacterium]
ALGVIIGIAAVIVMVAVGRGTQAELDRTMSRLGSNRIEIFASSARSGAVRLGAGTLSTLSSGDMDAIRAEIPEVQYVSGQIRGGGQVIFAERNWSTSWNGVSADYFPINNWQLTQGEWFGPRDYAGAGKVAIIGTTVRDKLFDGSDPIGATIRLARVPLRVVGVLESKGQSGWGGDADDVIMVPLESARRRLSGTVGLSSDGVQQISVGVGRAEDLGRAAQALGDLLRQRHRVAPGGEDDFTIRNLSEIVSTRTQTTRLMSLLLGAVAGISLLVGGIGIMNIMLVSVTERIREIGLRMAVGAGPREVRLQFLAEAMMISLGGGVIGIVLGVVGAQVMSRVSALPVQLDAPVIVLATAFSVATGLFFGYYPARKASNLDPIEALRQ